MSAQTSYGFSSPAGFAGGIYDLAPYAIDTFANEEAAGVMEFGIAVVTGTAAGKEVKKPVAASTKIEGITINNRTTEYDLEGKVAIKHGAAIGVMRYGRVWAKVDFSESEGVKTFDAPSYGDAVYVRVKGNVGYVTHTADSSNSGTIAVKGRFLSGAANGIALVELFNEAQ